VGCGAGRETAEIWLRYGGDIQITAIDAVPRMVEVADRKFESHVREIAPNHPTITASNRPVFKTASAVDLPFDDNSFDCVFWAFILHWTSNPGKVISESARVTQPGGLIIGCQTYKPIVNPYFNLIVRSNRNSFGFTWKEDLINWFEESRLDVEIVTPAGIFIAKSKPDVVSA
jgi:ubiquinone/menaquinone biosynthesis C-methylase UbiE